jgi:hypothetical protein
MGILAPIGDESSSYWIAGNVSDLSTEIFISTNDVIVEILLPRNAGPTPSEPETAALFELDNGLP